MIRFLFLLILTAGLTIALSIKIKAIPPVGKFLDPFHGFWQNAETKKIAWDDQVVLEGLQGRVQIAYDDRLVPHLFAENEDDLFRLQGYVTAANRLWQMEFQTHVAAGRLSEIVGKSLGDTPLEMDRRNRRRGMVFGAQNALKAMQENPEINAAVEQYAKGVNDYINSLSPKDYPVEYKLLGYAPEPWTPLKTALLLKYMAENLSGYDRDFEYTAALQLFGKEYMDILYPNVPNAEAPVVEAPGKWNFDPVKADTTLDNSLSREAHQELVPLVDPQTKPDLRNGSNNWAVSGKKTASGNPILCNDPHLGLNLPAIWYEMQLTAPGVRAYGVTLPGAPNIIIGFNDSIAWGVTNARRDVTDWYKIEFKDQSKNEYRSGNQWLKTRRVVEEIKIKGAETLYDTVYYTHLGPVVYDENFSPGKNKVKANYAFRWMAHDPSLEALAFYKLNRAKNYADFKAAIAYYDCPAQNMIFASANNDIALWVQGKFPVKWKEQGKYVMNGADSAHAWKNYIPKAHNVHSFNPERGFVSSANQHPVDSTYPYYVFDPTYEMYRNRRINRVLDTMKNIRAEQMMKLQNDNYNLMAAEALPFFLSQLDSARLQPVEKEAWRVLKSWNYYNEAGYSAPAYFEAWIDSLQLTFWDEFNHPRAPLEVPDIYTSVAILKNRPDFELIDSRATTARENATQLLRATFSKAVAGLKSYESVKKTQQSGWMLNWANTKSTTLLHLVRLPSFSISNVPNGGNHNIVNATSERHGPSWRMVVEMDKKGVKGWGVYPGGQSGNPGSHYYVNMVDAWAKGGYYPLLFMNSAQSKDTRIIFTQTFSSR